MKKEGSLVSGHLSLVELKTATKSELIQLIEWCCNQAILTCIVRENLPGALTRIREMSLLKEMQEICDKTKGSLTPLEHRKLMDRFTVVNKKLGKIQDAVFNPSNP